MRLNRSSGGEQRGGAGCFVRLAPQKVFDIHRVAEVPGHTNSHQTAMDRVLYDGFEILTRGRGAHRRATVARYGMWPGGKQEEGREISMT